MDLEEPLARMANATLRQGPNVTLSIKRSATMDLKKIHRRNQDEDRARSLLITFKATFTKESAPDGKKLSRCQRTVD